jgi:hypothetical protein
MPGDPNHVRLFRAAGPCAPARAIRIAPSYSNTTAATAPVTTTRSAKRLVGLADEATVRALANAPKPQAEVA